MKSEMFLLIAALVGIFSLAGGTPLVLAADFVGIVFWGVMQLIRFLKTKKLSPDDVAALAQAGIQPAKERKLARMLRLLLVCVVIISCNWAASTFVPGFLLDWPGQNTVLYQNLEDAVKGKQYEGAITIIRERMRENIGSQERKSLEDQEVQLLIDWGTALKSDSNPRAYEKWREAKELGQRYGLTTQVAALNVLLQPTPTPRPTYTPFPTATATRIPTSTPTPVPTPIVRPGESNPCTIPKQFSTVEQWLLHPAVPQEASVLIPEEFGHASKAIQIEGNEVAICIAGSSDGKKAPKVDDQAEFDVYMGSTKIGGFPMPFYDSKTKGIKEWPPQKAEWLFPKPGTYRVNTILTDLIGKVRSSSELWLVIWKY